MRWRSSRCVGCARVGRDEEEAEESQAHEAVYRCKDANGQPHFGQSIPAECMGRDIEVLDNTGRVVRTHRQRRGDRARAHEQQEQTDARRNARR